MSCLFCKEDFGDGDSVAKIVRATVIGNEDSLRYQSGTDGGIVHIKCLIDFSNGHTEASPEPEEQAKVGVIRNNILGFLD